MIEPEAAGAGTSTTTRRRLVRGLAGGVALAAVPRAGVAQCEPVELRPGYPYYRGHVTGLNGVGDHACLEDLAAVDPGFDRAAEGAANVAAARRLGLAGTQAVWTWENRLAIEHEGGFVPTCYVCALRPTASGTGPYGSAGIAPDDPRLLIGGVGTTDALTWLSGQYPSIGGYLRSVTPYDHHLRVLLGMVYPGLHLNATEVRDGYLSLGEAFSQGGFSPDPSSLMSNLLAHGGYAPTPPSAAMDDQVLLVMAGLELVPQFLSPLMGPILLRQWQGVVSAWKGEMMKAMPTSPTSPTSPAVPPLAQRMREALERSGWSV